MAVYVIAQMAGRIGGAVLSNAMFAVPTTLSTKDRAAGPHHGRGRGHRRAAADDLRPD